MDLNIKIFTTYHNNKAYDRIENEVYVPVQCNRPTEDENIFDKLRTYCELTTQYWAWKNVDADYYGFSHYRRFLDFQDNEDLKTTDWGMIETTYLDADDPKELCIDPEKLRKRIGKYDMVTPYPIDTRKIGFDTVYDQYDDAPQLHIEDLELMMEIIEEKYPQYLEAAKKSIFGHTLYLCNIFVMRKELFEIYNEFLFGMLEEFDKRCDMSKYSMEGRRTPGHLGERMVGIFVTWLQMQKKYKIGHEHIVIYYKPEKAEPVKKAFEGNSVDIVLSSSEYFAPYCATAIQSVINHASPDRNYDIVILEREYSEYTKARIESMAKGLDNISIRVVNVARFFSKYQLSVGEHFSVETYFRLLIADLLPEYDKALYLDGDLVAMTDVAELFDTDMEGNTLAAVIDVVAMGTVNGWQPEMLEYYKRKVRLKDPLMQLNAGVLLMDLDKIRSQYTAKEMVRFAEYAGYKFADQDVLNSLFQGQVKWLDFEWNAPNDQKDNLRGYVATFAPEKYYTASQKAIKNPKIIHYLGTIKPWFEPRYQLAEEYWKVMRQTPFYDIVVHRLIVENCWAYTHPAPAPEEPKEGLLRKIAGVIMPIGTKRREVIKKILFKLIGKPYIKPAYVK